MLTISVRDARTQLRTLLDRVAAGEEVAIMLRGKVVARLVPPSSRRANRLPSLKSFRESIRVSGTPLSRTVLQNRKEERF